MLLALIVDDGDRDALALVLADAHHAAARGPGGPALGRASLEQLDHAGQTAGDVLAGDATGVERTHGELGAGLADRLGGDDPDRLAELDRLAGRQRTPVAGAHTPSSASQVSTERTCTRSTVGSSRSVASSSSPTIVFARAPCRRTA